MDPDELNTTHLNQMLSWANYFDDHYNYPGVERLASRYRGGQHCRGVLKTCGSFNYCIKVVFDDDQAWAVRFPVPGRVMYPEEKVRQEAAVLEFIKHNTQVPVPKLIAFGSSSENHDPEVGPFIITTWIEGVPLTKVLEQLPRPTWGPILRDDVDHDMLSKIHTQLSEILLDLNSQNFDKIGALRMSGESDQLSWSVATRPLTLKMNDIQSSGYVVVDAQPFDNTVKYLENLVQQNITQLYEQRNSADDAEDARRKFILRRRVQALVPHFVSKSDLGPFKLYCDDMHPRNMLIDENTYEITAILDWDWTYAAPREMSNGPLSWLILEDIVTWTTSSQVMFEQQLELFLKALSDAESRREQCRPTQGSNECRMSDLMRQCFEDGTFWFIQLLFQIFNFDENEIWPKLEPFLEKRGLLEVGVPDEKEVEEFVAWKMKDIVAYNHELQKKNDEQQAAREAESEIQESEHTDDTATTAKPLDAPKDTEMDTSDTSNDKSIKSADGCADGQHASSNAAEEENINTSNQPSGQASVPQDDYTNDDTSLCAKLQSQAITDNAITDNTVTDNTITGTEETEKECTW
ncbi:hypothetical protein E4T48_07044 [Aureobasidium sp. EXF-10727]|nr:hypothetical protein E4T48_07044 [Aureobasidium sp. EXF-10727]